MNSFVSSKWYPSKLCMGLVTSMPSTKSFNCFSSPRAFSLICYCVDVKKKKKKKIK